MYASQTRDLGAQFKNPFSFSVEDMEQYLHYIGGGAGALALTGVAAASAFYLASRPTPERPLFPLDAQCIVQPVSTTLIRNYRQKHVWLWHQR